MCAAVSKEEYLKRYLSGPTQEDKKKKKKKKQHGEAKPAIVVPRMRIIDTDVEVPSALSQAPEVYTVGDETHDDIEELPVVAAVEDHRDARVQAEEEFQKSGMWRTFTGEDIARKNLMNEVIKIEQTNLKDEPMDEEELSEFLKAQKKKKKRIKVEVKEEPESPPRRRHDSSASDASPRRRHDSSASDSSPPRRHASDRRAAAGSDSDASPPRKVKKEEAAADSDASPPRRGGSDSDMSPPRAGRLMKKTLDGKRAGLQKAADVKEELKKIKAKEKEAMEGLSHEVSGRYAETKVRGRLLEKEAKEKAEKEKKEVPEEVKEKFKTWNRGMAQVEAASARVESDLHEMSKPMTRGVEDEDRESHLKDIEHADDPMLAYMRKKKSKAVGKVQRMPQYEGPQPPANRFGILPGCRWDGVDRSNGFEKKLMTFGIMKRARDDEAYKWSTEDM